MKKILALIIVLVCCIATGCTKDKAIETWNSDTSVNSSAAKEVYKIKNLHNGDAKLLSNHYVVTNTEGKLTIIDEKGNIFKRYEDIDVSWCDICEDKIIVYGNSNKEVGICRIDEECNVTDNHIIMYAEADLAIDPAICHVEDKYYITVTFINGTVNNADASHENGLYTVKLYQSENLSEWEEVSEILAMKSNIEDIDLNYWNGKFYFTYEKETYDKKVSSINLMISEDKGEHWGQSLTLIEENGDNEPAVFEKTGSHFRLYYSSDIENPNSTYEGAKVYVQEFDENLQPIGNAVCIRLQNDNGNLLYDVDVSEDGIWYLFTEKYITESNLTLEKS